MSFGAFLLLLAPRFYQPWLAHKYTQQKADRHILDSLILVIESQTGATPQSESAENYFPFDPNTASLPVLVQLGIPEAVAQRIDKYRQKGGKFRSKSDLKKIYGLPEAVYQRLYDYIQLPAIPAAKAYNKSAERNGADKTFHKDVKKIQPFDINQADTAQLASLAGIGRVLSERIVKFRDALGGFHAYTQSKEVYGLNEKAIESLERYTFVAPGFAVKKVNINQADIKELSRHPYISYELAKAIMNHRKKYGVFTSVQNLKEVPGTTEELLKKLLPYISLE